VNFSKKNYIAIIIYNVIAM